jgi:ribosomal protein L29
MKYTDITKKTVADLKKEIADKREALRSFRFSIAGARVKDITTGRKTRKEIAQMLTALREKEKQGKV